MRQVAGNEARPARPVPHLDCDRVLPLAHGRMRGGFVETLGAHTILKHRQGANRYLHLAGVKCNACASGGRQQPSPVGIGARPRCLAQRGSCDGLGNCRRILVVRGARNLEGHHVGDALAVVDDLVRQRVANALQRGLKQRDRLALGYCATLPAGQQQDRVIGGHIAVNRDAIEARLRCRRQHCRQVR